MSNEVDRELLARAYHDYEAAAKAARAVWKGAGEGTLREAAADFLVHVRELRRNGVLLASPAAAPGAGARPEEPPPRCPVCESAMRDQRATKRGNQPDFKCVVRTCDGAVWLSKRNSTGR
jgi:hypothetical protein